VAGQSWDRGTVVLAWDHVRQGAVNIFDGHNVVFHEFAHQLDTEDGTADGMPILAESSRYRPYIRVVGAAYDRFLKRVEKGRKTVLDDYGATNPAEFFAVATETFFEKPWQLKKKRPGLYEEFRQYYGLDPSSWGKE
jgi:Mlc titration factor MtfA (ptsG expression regulator)